MADPAITEGVDVCPTPEPLCDAICRRLVSLNPRLILEPSAGDGNFVRAARRVWPEARVIAVEARLVENPCQDDPLVIWHEGLSIEEYVRGHVLDEVDLVLGNPPFSLAESHIRLLLDGLRKDSALAFLLRLGFYESKERLDFWENYPERYFAPIVPRPGFILNKHGKPGTDSQAYGEMVWQKGFTGRPTRLKHIVWEKPRACKAA